MNSYSVLKKSNRVAGDNVVKPGSLVAGVVDRITAHAVVLNVCDAGPLKGTISPEHLADHHGITEPS